MESNQFSKKSLTSMDLFCVLGRGAIALGSPRAEKSENFVSVLLGKPQQLGEFWRRQNDSCTRL